MSYLAWLVPIALGMGVVGLAAFMWSLRSGQYEDLEGAAERVLLVDTADAPLQQSGSHGAFLTGQERVMSRQRSSSEHKE